MDALREYRIRDLTFMGGHVGLQKTFVNVKFVYSMDARGVVEVH